MTINMQVHSNTNAFMRHTAQSTTRRASDSSESSESPNVIRFLNPQGSRRRVDIAGERAAWQEREARLREGEDHRISKINDEIANLLDSGLDDDFINMAVSSLMEEIAQIHEDREERAQLWAEREMLLLQQLQEERVREREEVARNAVSNSECDDVVDIDPNMHNLMLATARMDKISALQSTRARMASEENMLSDAVSNTQSPVQIGLNHTVMVRSGHIDQNDFRNTQLRSLRVGMARIDSTIRNEVGRMFRDSQTTNTEQSVSSNGFEPEVVDEQQGE